MKSDLIDIQVESRGNDVELTLSGSLGVAQLSALKEKLNMLVDGPGCFFFLNLQNAHFTSDDYLDVFLELLNRVKSQKSTLILIFDSMELYDYFEKYLNIFEVYENRNAYKKSGTKKQLQQIGLYYGLRSGITVSSGVAVAFLSLILGWIVTLLIIISTQGRELSDKQAQIIALQNQKDRYINEIDKLESSIGPLLKLGVVQDTTMLSSFGLIQDWVGYLEYLENTRRED
jgi:anti-anti-sigma regulatory factor